MTAFGIGGRSLNLTGMAIGDRQQPSVPANQYVCYLVLVRRDLPFRIVPKSGHSCARRRIPSILRCSRHSIGMSANRSSNRLVIRAGCRPSRMVAVMSGAR